MFSLKRINTRFIFIRHGERDHTLVVASNALIPLTPQGVMQASITGKFLASKLGESNEKDEIVILSSPFLRCLQTSEEICRELKRSYHLFPPLSEYLSIHEFSQHPSLHHPNRTSNSFQTDFPLSSPLSFPFTNEMQRVDLGMVQADDPPFPETTKMFRTRFETVLRTITLSYPSRTFVCVCHGAFLHLLGKRIWKVPDDPANLSIADIIFSPEKSTNWENCISKGPLGYGASHLPPEYITYWMEARRTRSNDSRQAHQDIDHLIHFIFASLQNAVFKEHLDTFDIFLDTNRQSRSSHSPFLVSSALPVRNDQKINQRNIRFETFFHCSIVFGIFAIFCAINSAFFLCALTLFPPPPSFWNHHLEGGASGSCSSTHRPSSERFGKVSEKRQYNTCYCSPFHLFEISSAQCRF